MSLTAHGMASRPTPEAGERHDQVIPQPGSGSITAQEKTVGVVGRPFSCANRELAHAPPFGAPNKAPSRRQTTQLPVSSSTDPNTNCHPDRSGAKSRACAERSRMDSALHQAPVAWKHRPIHCHPEPERGRGACGAARLKVSIQELRPILFATYLGRSAAQNEEPAKLNRG